MRPIQFAMSAGLAAIASVLALNINPLLAEVQAGNQAGNQAGAQAGNQAGKPSSILAQAQTRPEVKLKLIAAKRVTTRDAQGQAQVQWQPLSGNAAVQPGDVIRFTLRGNNVGTVPAKQLVLQQPIPKGTQLVLQSARMVQGSSEILYSIDQGKTFSRNPVITVTEDGRTVERAAPAEVYTHIQLRLSQGIAPQAQIEGEYQVRVGS